MEKYIDSLSGIDNLMIALDHPGPPPIITGLLQFDCRLAFTAIQQQVKNRVLCHDRFRMRPAGKAGSARWEIDLQFDTAYHIVRTPVAPPGGQEELQRLFNELATTPLDPSRPLWRVHYIENTEDGGSALFFRIHHCIGDGIALVNLLVSISGSKTEPAENRPAENTPDNETANRNSKRAGRHCHKACNAATKKIKSVVSDPDNAKKCVKNTGIAVSETAMTIARVLMLPPDRKYFFKNAPGIHRQLAWSAPLPLDGIKRTGAYYNATVNDIIAALATGGLRRYLSKDGDMADTPALRMAVPVNLRQNDSKGNESVELKNEFGFVLAPLPIFIKDPVRRIRRIRSTFDKLKRSSDASAAWAGMNALGAARPDIARKTATLFAEKITGIISNVPGPGKAVHFAGAAVKNIMFWLPLIKGMGIGISVISYNNTVCIGIVTDAGMVPDPESIIGHIEDEYNTLAEKCPY